MGDDERPPAHGGKIHVRVKGNKGSGKGKGSGLLVAHPKHRSRSRSAHLPTMNLQGPPEVVMRVGEVQAVQDALGRAINATEHAAQLSRSASKVFDDSTASLQVENTPLHYVLLPSTTSTTTTITYFLLL